MAAKPKKGVTAPTTAPAGALNLSLLLSIANAAFAGTYQNVNPAEPDVAALIAAQYIEVNPNALNADGHPQSRATQAGQDYLTAHKEEIAKMQTANTPAAAPAAAPGIALVSNFELPEAAPRRGGVARTETYPFGTMEVKQAFFIAATAEKPNPERSFASTVTSARERYAVPAVPAATRKNRKGVDVPVMTYPRDFKIRRITDGAAFGKPGVAGAVVVRVA